MISKKTFCHALEMIREQGEVNEQVSEALQLVGDGFYLFGSKDKYLSALLEVLQEAMTGMDTLNGGSTRPHRITKSGRRMKGGNGA